MRHEKQQPAVAYGAIKKTMVHGSLLIIPLTLGVMFSVEGPDCIIFSCSVVPTCGGSHLELASCIGMLGIFFEPIGNLKHHVEGWFL